MSSKLQTVVRFHEKGPVSNVLGISSIPIPDPPDNYSLVQVHASAINLSDVGNVEGRFQQTTLPRIPGRDFAGVVVKGPAGSIGKKVWGTGGTHGFDRDGSHAEYIVIPSDFIVEMPENLNFSQAAACGVGFMTAGAMVDKAKPNKGDYVLVLGSSGAVGTAATQLIRQHGAIPLETSRNGQPGTINITEDLEPQIQEKTQRNGITAVIDTVGEATLFKKALDVLADNGRHVLITAGRTPGFQFTFNAFDFYRNNKSILGLNTGTISFEEAVAQLANWKKGFETGELLPPRDYQDVDITDEKAVIAAFEEVKRGTKRKQILVNRNLH